MILRMLIKLYKCLFLLLGFLLYAIIGLSDDPQPAFRFVQNKTQWPKDILFSTDLRNGKIDFLKDRFRFYFLGDSQSDVIQTKTGNLSVQSYYEDGHTHEIPRDLHVYEVSFPGFNPDAEIVGNRILTMRYNYFLGSDKSLWSSNVMAFAGVKYNDAYCGVDLDIYSDGDNLKYEWSVSPGANPYQVQLNYEGVDQIEIRDENLWIKTSVNEITELKPFAYQYIDGRQVSVPCFFKLEGNIVSYELPQAYDPCYPLTIDPILIFSAYSGSLQDNWGNTAAYDSHGNVYSGGMVDNEVRSNGFPTTPGAYKRVTAGGLWDVGILKYDSSGSSLLYATYLGGNDTETPQSLVVNSKGELLVLGATGSANFPVTNGSIFGGGEGIIPIQGIDYVNGTDIFVAKLSEDGSQLLGGTYLGGSNNDGVNFISGDITDATSERSPLAKNYGDQLRGDIITDENDLIYISSNTNSPDFTGVTNEYGGGSHDGVVIKLTADLSSILSAQYLGGTGTDAAYSIKVKGSKVYTAGGTNSLNFPSMNGLKVAPEGDIDGWVAELSSADLSITNATYLGTSKYDQVYFIDLNASGDVYVFGQTKGKYKVAGKVYADSNAGQFIHKLSSDLKTTHFSTVVGSVGKGSLITPNISPTAFLVSDCNNLYLSGWGGATNKGYIGGNTQNMPVSPEAYQKTSNGSDFYLMVLSADASEFLYGTYLGGKTSAVHVDGGTSRFDKQGIVYHAVCAGCGGNSDFPAANVPLAHQQNKSSNCNNAVFKFDLALLKARLQTNTVRFNNPGITQVCMPDKIVFQNQSIGGEIFYWDLGDGTKATTYDSSSITHGYKKTGQYLVKLKAVDQGTCKGIDSTSIVVYVHKAQGFAQDDDDLCEGASYKLTAGGGIFYEWQSGGITISDQATPSVNPTDTTDYYITVTDLNGCLTKDTVQLNVVRNINPDFKLTKVLNCLDRPFVRVDNITDSLDADDIIYFDFGDGHTTDQITEEHHYEEDGLYHFRLIGARHGCVFEKTVEIPAFTLNIPNVITPGGSAGLNDSFVLKYRDAAGSKPGDYGHKVSLIIYNRWGTILYENNNYQNDWAGDGLAAGVYYYEITVEGNSSCKSWLQIIK